jgi:flavin-dependent dehydrogenase
MTDLVVVGGGPVGLATAIHAAQRGLSAVVLERRMPPLDKACGEGLMPPGVAALAEMGVVIAEHERAPFVGIRYVDGPVVAEARFAERPGWGVRRTVLAEAMATRARALGVDLRHGCAMKGWRPTPEGVLVESAGGALRARMLVGADGLRSRVRRDAGLARALRGRPRFGVRRHYRCKPWSPFVEVHWSERAEAYVTPIGPEEVGVAILWDGSGGRFEALLDRFSGVRARLASALPTSGPRGAGPFRQGVRRRSAGGVALVGDAAGYLDALTGEGLTLGFHTAAALVDTIAQGRPLVAYERAYRQLTRTYYRTTALLLGVARQPWLRARLVRTLARHPDLFARFLAIACGEERMSALGVGGVLRLLEGLAR